LNYNALLSTSETTTIAKHVILVVTTKPNIHPIVINEMVELTINQPIVEEKVDIELESYYFKDEI
jgi:hypothetical protein